MGADIALAASALAKQTSDGGVVDHGEKSRSISCRERSIEILSMLSQRCSQLHVISAAAY